MGDAYRSAYEAIVGPRVARATEAREVIDPLAPKLREMWASRIARIVAGGTGVAGAAVMIVAAFTREHRDPGASTYVLLLAWVVASLVYLVVRGLVANGGGIGRAPSLPSLTGRLDVDLVELDASEPTRWLRAAVLRLERVEQSSFVLPLAAVALLAPLTLHFVVALLFSSQGVNPAAGYSNWIWLSVILVGHAHLALLLLSWRFARKMRRMGFEELAQMRVHREWGKALGITVAVSCVPGLVFLGLPPVMVAVTGLTFVPFMFIVARQQLLAERAVLAQVDHAAQADVRARVAPPVAVAVDAPVAAVAAEFDDVAAIERERAAGS